MCKKKLYIYSVSHCATTIYHMTTKKTLLVLSTITVLIIVCSSCAPKRRWWSVYKDKNDETKVEQYNEYKRKWYKKNFNNGQIWK